MSERVMRNPRYEIVPDGNDVLLRFRVPGSKFGTITISLLDADARNFLDVLAAALGAGDACPR